MSALVLPQGWRSAGEHAFKFQSSGLTMEVDSRRGLVAAQGWEQGVGCDGERSWELRPLEAWDFVTIGREVAALGEALGVVERERDRVRDESFAAVSS